MKYLFLIFAALMIPFSNANANNICDNILIEYIKATNDGGGQKATNDGGGQKATNDGGGHPLMIEYYQCKYSN